MGSRSLDTWDGKSVCITTPQFSLLFLSLMCLLVVVFCSLSIFGHISSLTGRFFGFPASFSSHSHTIFLCFWHLFMVILSPLSFFVCYWFIFHFLWFFLLWLVLCCWHYFFSFFFFFLQLFVVIFGSFFTFSFFMRVLSSAVVWSGRE